MPISIYERSYIQRIMWKLKVNCEFTCKKIILFIYIYHYLLTMRVGVDMHNQPSTMDGGWPFIRVCTCISTCHCNTLNDTYARTQYINVTCPFCYGRFTFIYKDGWELLHRVQVRLERTRINGLMSNASTHHDYVIWWTDRIRDGGVEIWIMK